MMEQDQIAPGSFKILVVEDEFLIGIELQNLLEDGGYEVIGPVATVAAAIAILKHNPPDACVLDVSLRGEYSAGVAQLCKERGVPVLLSSAYKKDTLEQHSAFDGVINIGKPAPPTELLSRLAGMLQT